MHVMIDIETLSTRTDAVILQIGAVAFEPLFGGKVSVGDAYSRYVDFTNQPRHVDADTLIWWLEQDHARDVLVRGLRSDDALDLAEVLQGFGEWYAGLQPSGVWSHGAAFDIPILESACVQYGYQVPWGRRDIRDTRTLYAFREEPRVRACADRTERWFPETFTKHDALHDAVYQAVCVQDALRGQSL